MSVQQQGIVLPKDLVCEEEFEVKKEHLASTVVTGNVEVLSTPNMIAFMENVAFRCAQKYLPEGFTTVGVRVDVRHKNPAPLGSRVRVKAELVEQRDRLLVFKVTATLGNTIIGEGIHERYIIEKSKFEEKVLKILESIKLKSG
jgi:predicted thioesterase